jgi:hypothetical protein
MRPIEQGISMKTSGFTAGLAIIFVFSAMSFASDDAITLRAGTELDVQLITTLSSKANDTGDMWTGKVVMPIFGPGGEIVPDGSTVDGHITFVKDPSRPKSKGEMQLTADSISMPDGSKYDLATAVQNTQNAKERVEGTGLITVSARSFSKKGKETALPAGTEVTFAISRDTKAEKVPVKP